MIGDRWGVTDAEVRLPYPCDLEVPGAQVQAWRGVSVAATPAQVWPWLRQLRLAPYSYDWVDNLGRRSPRELRDLPDPQPGEPFTTVAARFDCGRVLSVVPGEQLTAEILGSVMSYVVTPDGPGSRLLMKLVLPRRRWWSTAMVLGDLPMARKQLLNLKRLAEGEQPPDGYRSL